MATREKSGVRVGSQVVTYCLDEREGRFINLAGGLGFLLLGFLWGVRTIMYHANEAWNYVIEERTVVTLPQAKGYSRPYYLAHASEVHGAYALRL
jgi:hypothetical protein